MKTRFNTIGEVEKRIVEIVCEQIKEMREYIDEIDIMRISLEIHENMNSYESWKKQGDFLEITYVFCSVYSYRENEDVYSFGEIEDLMEIYDLENSESITSFNVFSISSDEFGYYMELK